MSSSTREVCAHEFFTGHLGTHFEPAMLGCSRVHTPKPSAPFPKSHCPASSKYPRDPFLTLALPARGLVWLGRTHVPVPSVLPLPSLPHLPSTRETLGMQESPRKVLLFRQLAKHHPGLSLGAAASWWTNTTDSAMRVG